MARARVRFSTSGANKVTGAFGSVGMAAGGAQGRVGKFGTGIGGVFYKVMRNVGRLTMFSAGVQKMGKSATGAKRSIEGMADGSITALSGMSKKFAELRRQFHFFGFAAQKIASPFKRLFGISDAKKTKAPTKDTSERQASRSNAILYRKYTSTAEDAARKRKEILSRKYITGEGPSTVGIAASTTAWQKFLAVLTSGGGKISSIAAKILNLRNVVKVLVASLVILSVAGGIAFVAIGYQTAKFAKRAVTDFMSIREAFRQYEISLGGIIKNTYAMGKIMKFATKYASEYPAMFEEVVDTFRGLAALPALKPMFRRADTQDLKKVMDIIQGFATLDPIQGVKGAGIALREALSGDMRSIRRRFEISAHAIAAAGGYAMEEITQDSEKALKAFHAFIKLNVPAKSMADAAMTIGIQVGNLKDKYRSFVNDIMKSTGAYFSVVTALNALNDWLTKVFASPVIKQWATAAGKHIRAFVETLKAVLSSVDWDKYLKSGDLLGGVVESIQKVTLFLKTIVGQWIAPFLVFVRKVAVVLWEGLVPVVKESVKMMGKLFLVGMVETGKMAAIGFAHGFMRKLSYVLGWLGGTISGQGAKMGKATEDAYNTAVDYYGKKKKGISISAGADWDEGSFKSKIKKIYQDSIIENKPEVVTPEAPIEDQELHIKHLQREIGAAEKMGATKKRLETLTNNLEEAELKLAGALRIKNWEANQGIGRGETQKLFSELEAAEVKAAKAGKVLTAGHYEQKEAARQALVVYDKQYGRIVEQKFAIKDLISQIKAAPDSLKAWIEQYKIGKKDAGSLLLVVKKLNDIASGKVKAKPADFLALLKKRIQLTEEARKKEKEYQKQLTQIPKNIAQSLAQLAGGLQSSILSFVDKLSGAFIGIGKWGGAEAEPEPEVSTGILKGRTARKAARKAAEDKVKKEEKEKAKESRESTFRRKVMWKIGAQTMVPENVFGMGRKGMTYQTGLGEGAGKKIPPYINYMLKGIETATAAEKGPAEFVQGRKAMAEMKMALLEKAIPFTPHRSEARAEIYAKMAGAQTDIMKGTMDAAMADVQMQQNQLTELKENRKNTGLAVTLSERVVELLDLIVKAGKQTPTTKVGTVDIASKTSEANPSTGGDTLAFAQ